MRLLLLQLGQEVVGVLDVDLGTAIPPPQPVLAAVALGHGDHQLPGLTELDVVVPLVGLVGLEAHVGLAPHRERAVVALPHEELNGEVLGGGNGEQARHLFLFSQQAEGESPDDHDHDEDDEGLGEAHEKDEGDDRQGGKDGKAAFHSISYEQLN